MKRFASMLMATALVITTLLSSVSAFTLKEQTYLSDLTPVNSTIGWGTLQMDKSVDGNPITLLNADGEKVVYDKGIGTHCDSVITYDISEYTAQGYNVFDCFVGMDTECLPDVGSAIFSVSVDGEVVYTTGAIRTDEPAQQITVDITDAEELKLSATASVNSFTHADWADAKIGKSDDVNFNTTKYVIINKGKSWLNVNDTTDIDVNAVNGDEVTNLEDSAAVSYTSSNVAVATVDAQGKVTAVAGGSAVITATYTDGENSGTLNVSVYVAGNGIVVFSPDGSIQAEILLDGSGSIKYAVAKGNEIVINQSNMGINTSIGDFRSGLTFESFSSVKVQEEYYMHSGKAEYYSENANETTIVYSKGGKTFKVIVNVANDSFAYRYVIDGETSFNVTAEASSYAIPGGATVYCCDYESFYENDFVENAAELVSGNKGMCFLYKTNAGTLVLINEADMSNNYSGSSLNVSKSVAKVTPVEGTIRVTGDFETPWRVAVIGDAATIAECQTFENLSDPSVVEDADEWVHSKVTSWDWLTSQVNNDPEEFKIYIDQAAEMGWGYLLMDDGWAKFDETETIILPEWLGEVLDYAEERGIDVLAWLDNKYVNTKAKAETNLKILADNGIKGIKVDFFNSESQGTIQNMIRISEICAENHLLVNMHGANKATGERRTYPHVLTREGILGCEYGGGTNAFNNVLLPLARGAVGPADYTPQLLAKEGQYTTNQSSAMTVISESGIMCVSTYPKDFSESVLTQWFVNLPSRWHETKLINADLGKSITMARRYEDRWYMSSITVSKKNMSLPLDFLDEGATYLATIFYDTDDINVSGVRYELVEKGDVINVALKEKGGANIRLDKQYTMPTGIEFSKDTVTVPAGLSEKFDATLVGGENVDVITYTIADESVALVVSNGKTAVVKGLKAGETVITATVTVGDTTITKTIPVVVQGKEIYGENLALGKDVIVDSEGTMVGTNMNDGDMSSRWQNSIEVKDGVTAFAGIDFGEEVDFNTLFLYWETARATSSGYKVQVSNDGENWVDVEATVTRDIDVHDITFDIVNFDAVKARYVRINISAMEGKYTNPSLYEFEVYNIGGGSGTDIPTPEFKLGDVNGDGTINSTDFMQVRRHYLGLFTIPADKQAAADVNGDGKINSTDFMQIRRHFLGLFVIGQ